METSELGCVYFIRLNGLTPVKIGYSTKSGPQDRLDTIRTSSPFGAELIGFILSSNSKALETALHKELKDVRLHGEWFDITTEKVRSICEKHMHIKQRDEMSKFYEAYSNLLSNRSSLKIERPCEHYTRVSKFLNETELPYGERIDKAHLCELYNDQNKINCLTGRKMTSLVRKYFNDMGIIFKEGKSGHVRWIMIHNSEK